MQKYSSFYLSMLFESIFQVDSKFIEVLNKIEDPISDKLNSLINKDIKTQYNFIQRGDTEDQVYFLPDSQGQKAQDPWVKKNNSAKIGRLVNQILASQGMSITPAEVEKFVNSYKTAWKEINTIQDPIQLVSGEDIKYWYNSRNYAEPEGGVLGNSCMRYPRCGDFFKIYTKNPDICQLAILLDDNEKLIGRCLVWQIKSNRIYIDRIYTLEDSDVQLMYNNLKKKFPTALSHYMDDNCDDYVDLSVKLKFDFSDEFRKPEDDVKMKFPYMDSLFYFYPLSNILSNQLDESQFCLKLQDTSGDFSVYSEIVWSNYEKDFINKDDYIYSKGDWLPKSAVEQDVFGTWHLKGKLVHSDLYNGLIFDPIKTNWGLAPRGNMEEIGGISVPDIFRDNTDFDPQSFPVFTYLVHGYHFVRNLKKSIQKDDYLVKGIPMLSIPSNDLKAEFFTNYCYRLIIYYKNNYPVGISNIVGSFQEENLNKDFCYTISEWIDLLPNSLKESLTIIQEQKYYVESLREFSMFLSKGVEFTGDWDNLLLIEQDSEIKSIIGNINLDKKPSLTEGVVEYIRNFHQRVRNITIPLIVSNDKIQYNEFLKEEYSKKDLLNDSEFIDFLFNYINRFWIDLNHRKYLRMNSDEFEKYFIGKEGVEILFDLILDDLIYPQVYRNDLFKNSIMCTLDNNSYYRNELERTELFG